MDLDLVAEEVPGLIQRALDVPVGVRDDTLWMEVEEGDIISGPSLPLLQGLLAKLDEYELEPEATIHTPRDMEVLVREEAPFIGPGLGRRAPWPLVLEDPDRGLRYTLGPPSDHFMLFLLDRLATLGPSERFFWLRRHRVRRRNLNQGDLLEPESAIPEITILDVLRDSMPRLHTLRIESERDLRPGQLQKLSDAFAFQIAYNLDIAFVSVRSLEEVLRRSRLRRMRRVRPEDLEPPRRIYESDLVYHYQLGVSTDSIPLEFLSYYHVAEHFFESVFEDDLITSVREQLTQPDFSFRRKPDVQTLIRLVRDRLKFQREDVTFSEPEALRLVIERYVNLDALARKLGDIQESLFAYYKENAVSFSKGDRVNLREDDTAAVGAALSRRIYKTRNAVVHSKEGGRPRYMPFRHDRELAQELPLMRLLAEEILINSGTVPT